MVAGLVSRQPDLCVCCHSQFALRLYHLFVCLAGFPGRVFPFAIFKSPFSPSFLVWVWCRNGCMEEGSCWHNIYNPLYDLIWWTAFDFDNFRSATRFLLEYPCRWISETILLLHQCHPTQPCLAPHGGDSLRRTTDPSTRPDGQSGQALGVSVSTTSPRPSHRNYPAREEPPTGVLRERKPSGALVNRERNRITS